MENAHRKLVTFALDVDSITPGIVLDGNDFVPTLRGFRTLPSLMQVTNPLPEPCLGAACLTFTDGSSWIVAGTQNTLCSVNVQQLDANTPPNWGVFNIPFANTIHRWRFAIFQDHIIATD